MIAQTCPFCGKKLSLKDDLAGKRIRCPSCKQPQDVAPAPLRTVGGGPVPPSLAEEETLPPSRSPAAEAATLPPSRSPGSVGDVSLPPTWKPGSREANDAPAAGRSVEELLAGKPDGQRYVMEKEIGRGGMGAVLRAVDCEIRREVAVKFLLNQADEPQKRRFIEEAQITGQLEHPNIVPIHDLGIDGEGRLFFSMKMVKGRSLSQVLGDLRAGRAEAVKEYTLGRLLTIFSNMGNALAYAHARRVIHRDLKPANVMLGDFGEVYVMDWGLAKVLGRPDARSESAAGGKITALPDKVVTNRTADAQLTQDGSVMGTPAYMPPEQALGETARIDQRSDIYALGAILYEILTLSPPVSGADPLAVLVRVAEGAIDPPEKQAPERAHRGLIPPELSAVAMKALARNPADRYQTAEALQRDIQLFLEGRSVSARRDSAWELCKKLVKRNKGVSAATAASLLVLVVVVAAFLKINYDARVAAETARTQAEENFARAEENYERFRSEREAKRQEQKKSAPVFVDAARLLAADRQFAGALTQVTTALDYDQEQVGAHLLHGQLLLGLERFSEAVAPLQEYLKRKPGDQAAGRLLALARKPEPDKAAYFLSLNDVFQQQKALALAGHMAQRAESFLGPLRERMPVYRKRIEAGWPDWPGLGNRLVLHSTGELRLDLAGVKQVNDVAPLKGMPLSVLSIAYTPVEDLTPLQGMPLSSLNIGRSRVSSLEPLRGLPLRSLVMFGYYGGGSPISDLGPLQGMKLKHLDISFTNKVSDLSPLRGMPLEHLEARACTKLTSLEPLRESPLAHLLLFDSLQIEDLTPLRGMKTLKLLNLGKCAKVKDIGPLAGLPLEVLRIDQLTRIRDFEPLRGMPLRYLHLGRCRIQDLDVLRGMPLLDLDLDSCDELKDLAPLRGMKLTFLRLDGCKRVQDFGPLAEMPLTTLSLNGTAIRDLALVRGLKKLEELAIRDCPAITDLTPLEGMRLKTITLTPRYVKKGMDVLRRMGSLEKVWVDQKRSFEAAQFWKLYDEGKFGK
jgi:serine/threonine protein kinase/Leucine-rich repeat (LRR) protein